MTTYLKNLKKKQAIKPLPFLVYYIAVTLLSLGGLLVSLYLSFSHYKVYTDITYKSFCAISKAINCDTVSQSPSSILWGMPVAVWGVASYFFFLCVLGLAYQRDARTRRLWALLVLIALGFSGYSVLLALISTFIVHSYCIMCLVSYGVNFTLLFYSDLVRRRFKDTGFWRSLKLDILYLLGYRWRLAGMLALFGIALIAGTNFFPRYWELTPPRASAKIATGITADGHPWIGASDPELVITEYADYRCFQCKKMHYFLRQLIASQPTKIRLVHRHFPMDHEFNPLVKEPFHVGSGKLALLAIGAVKGGKFWQTNDALFAISNTEELDLREFGELVDIDASELARSLNDDNNIKKLRADIVSALKQKISGTPAYRH